MTPSDSQRPVDAKADPAAIWAALQETRDTISAIEEIAQLGRWDWDLTSSRMTGSASIYTIFGLDPKKDLLSPDNFMESVYPEDHEFVRTVLQNAISKVEPAWASPSW